MPENLGNGHLVLGDGLPARYQHHVAFSGNIIPAREGPEPSVHGPPHWESRQCLGVRVGEPNSLCCKGIDVRGSDPIVPVGAHVVPSETVQHYQNDVTQNAT